MRSATSPDTPMLLVCSWQDSTAESGRGGQGWAAFTRRPPIITLQFDERNRFLVEATLTFEGKSRCGLHFKLAPDPAGQDPCDR